MPPKVDLNDPAVAEQIALFQAIGLDAKKAQDVAGSAKQSAALREIIDANGLATKSLDAKRGTLLAQYALKISKLEPAARDYGVNAIVDGKLKTADQVDAAAAYLESHSVPINDAEFDDVCGVGFSITNEEIYEAVTSYVKSAAYSGWSTFTSALNATKQLPNLRWAPTRDVKDAVERVFIETFGPKAAAKPPAKESKTAKPAASSSKPEPEAEAPSAKTVFEEGFLGALHKPGENPQIDPALREQHLAATGGKVFTRFPPEPNGFLHIGHSKAIFVNFGYAAHHGGKCYLRYDDTNPEAEEAKYFESILEIVRWLGYEPFRITYSSDYFQQLYDLGVKLIQVGKGYCCSCTAEEMNINRGGKEHGERKACVHRERPIEESLRIFEEMKNGKYARGEMTMRMKQDLTSGNPQMWDLVAYRVVNAPHHRTGTTWCIYPTYDFTHCLCDSFENISHSLCTTEFIDSRESYEWLCDQLRVYKPRQSEYGRLNIEGTVMSKRKLLRLVKEGHVSGWDDPRMYTLVALRRRGIPPGAILSFVGGLGVTVAASNIQAVRFEHAVRQYLENSVPRLMMVLRPLKVTIESIPEGEVIWVEKPLHPKVPALGSSKIPLTRTVYIDVDDFRLQDSKDYFRLAPGKSVGLLQAPHPVVYVSHKTDPATETVTEVVVRFDTDKKSKPKAFIQWVAEHKPSGSPVIVDETRIFNRLFRSDNPAASPDYIADINPDSLEVVRGAMVEVGFLSLAKRAHSDAVKEALDRQEAAKKLEQEAAAAPALVGTGGHGDEPHATAEQLVGNECVRFQGMRVAYFALDKDARLASLSEGPNVEPRRHDGDYVVLNRIVSLKEDAGKTN